jgi:hypothetical protein
MGEVRNQYKIPGGKCRKKKEFHWKTYLDWKIIVKRTLEETEGMDWIILD